MMKRILLGLALLAAMVSAPVRAQVVGEWQFEMADGSVASIRVSREPATPSKMNAKGDLNGNLIVFEGDFVNLEWKGKWYWFGDASRSLPGLPVCAEAVRGAPRTRPNMGSTRHAGAFAFRFNAAENRIDGVWESACPLSDGRVRMSPPVPFAATRMNTLTQRVTTVPISGSVGAVSGTPPAMAPMSRDDAPCTDVAVFKISNSGSLGVPDTVFSSRYRIRPCMISVGSKIQLDLLNPEGKRPIRLHFEAMRINSLENIGLRQRYTAIPTGATHAQGLAFVGEPRAGQALGNIPVAGRLCSAPLWRVWLDFSDGTRSAEPVGMLFSLCGIKLHPELIPPELRSRGSDRDGPRPAGELRPAGG